MVWTRSAARNLGKKNLNVNTIIENIPKRTIQRSADGDLIILLEKEIHPPLKAQIGAGSGIVARFKRFKISFASPVLGILFQKLSQSLFGKPVFLGKPLCPWLIPAHRGHLPQGLRPNIPEFLSRQSHGFRQLSGPHEMPTLDLLLQLFPACLLAHSFDTFNRIIIQGPGQGNSLTGPAIQVWLIHIFRRHGRGGLTLLLRLLCNHGLGRQHKSCNRARVLQR
jgi:hypothetical protein